MTIGILALQGAFAEHADMLDRLGTAHITIRKPADLERHFDGLILPGGESTVMGKLLRELELLEPLRGRICRGLPVMGTCAGLILLAGEVEGGVPAFATMHVRVRRNAYGRQDDSFDTEDNFRGIGKIPMTFIRAPYIVSVSGGARTLAKTGGRIVAAREENQLGCAFHPELTGDLRVHRYFLDMVRAAENHI